ncbi:MAG: nucleotidyltransferase domain-containing protein [Bacteroidetes bacterium]|nr:MAG: nucleotidyltransferase domain-containing protein [Bacteroidota bacterium]
MIDIEKLKPEIIECLKPLNPDKIILFGSYAYGTPTEYSDIDLFIVKDIKKENIREYKLNAKRKIRNLIVKYKTGFDIIVASENFLKTRTDYFYQVDILQNGKILYE